MYTRLFVVIKLIKGGIVYLSLLNTPVTLVILFEQREPII